MQGNYYFSHRAQPGTVLDRAIAGEAGKIQQVIIG